MKDTKKFSLFIKTDQLDWTPMAPGLKRKILGYDSKLMMVRVEFESGTVAAKHHHPHRQASYIESGTFEVEIAGEKQTLKAGNGFFIPPDVVHAVTALEAGSIIDAFTPAREDFLR
jgi:quercetin dioxygenase-like cupin family protein